MEGPAADKEGAAEEEEGPATGEAERMSTFSGVRFSGVLTSGGVSKISFSVALAGVSILAFLLARSSSLPSLPRSRNGTTEERPAYVKDYNEFKNKL